MRWRTLLAPVVLLVGVGCTFEKVATPCGPDGECPEGTICDPRVNRCLPARDSQDSASADGTGADGPGTDARADGPGDGAADGPGIDGPAGDGGEGDALAEDGPAPDQGPTYTWQDDNWTPVCSPCWGGTQTGDVWCERNDGTEVDDSFCDAGTKPDNPRDCAAPTEVCYWWRATNNCIHLYGKCATGPDEWFLDWDCCSTAALNCDLPGEDCKNAIGDHLGTCHAGSDCGGHMGKDYKYPE
jgi:hypothetical protein